MTARTAWSFLLLVALLEVVSTYLFLASVNFSLRALVDPARIEPLTDSAANYLRLASLLDAAGYLAAIPLALFLRDRFRDSRGIVWFTLAGLAFLYLGAAGGVILAVAGPAAYRFVVFGIWQGVDPVLVAIWLIPIGVIAGLRGARVLPFALVAIAVLGLLVLLGHLARIPAGFWRG